MAILNRKLLVPWALIPAVCFIGACFAFASLWNHTGLRYGLQVGPSFCNIGGYVNCDAVTQSKYSSLFGLPLEGYGLAFYLSLFVLSCLAAKDRFIPKKEFIDVLVVSSLLASIFSLVLLYISTVIIKALCILCVGMHFTNFTLLLIAWGMDRQRGFRLRVAQGAATLARLPVIIASSSDAFPRARRISLALIVLLLVAFVLFLLPPLVARAIASRSPQQQTISEVLAMAVNDWKSQPLVDIPVVTEGAFRDFSKGSSFAPFRLVEFSDYECPACRIFHAGLSEILRDFGDRIHFVHKNYPLDSAYNPVMDVPMHPNACFLANAARCAGEQDKFWEMNEAIFTLPEIDEDSASAEVIAAAYAAASNLNLDVDALKACIESGRQLEKVRQDIVEGERLGLSGTPSLWLNGRKVKLANPKILRRLLENLSGS